MMRIMRNGAEENMQKRKQCQAKILHDMADDLGPATVSCPSCPLPDITSGDGHPLFATI